MTLRLLPTRVRARVRVFFTNAGMEKGTIVPYALGTHCHPILHVIFIVMMNILILDTTFVK